MRPPCTRMEVLSARPSQEADIGRRRSLIAIAISVGMVTPGPRLAQAASGRTLAHGIRLRREHGSEGFEYLYHEPSQQWVGQECQLRVAAARPLPEPLSPPGRERSFVVQQFGGLTIENARILGGVTNMQRAGDWRWWWIDKSMGDTELKRAQRLGVQLFWPGAQADDDRARRAEPMELFQLPEIDVLPPGQWTPWKRADAAVDAANAAWQVANGRAPGGGDASVPQWPFEVRCRAALWETPYFRKRS
jgi:hypothetical protein